MTGILSLADCSTAELNELVIRSVHYHRRGISKHSAASGRVVGTYFAKTSTRTRTAFGSAALRLGAHLLTYGPDDLQTNTGESWTDTARTLAEMLDLLVMRTAGPLTEMRAFSEAGGLPVINAMAEEEHPTQALADLTALSVAFGRPDDLSVVYVGEGNNTAVALAMGLTRFENNTVTLCCPEGYGIPDEAYELIKRTAAPSSRVVMTDDLGSLPSDADVVYTTRWQTTGTSKANPAWWETFRPFHVDTALLDRMPKAKFMHDLPAHRGQEVTSEVLDGPRSLAWLQVSAKLSSAAAAIVSVLEQPRLRPSWLG